MVSLHLSRGNVQSANQWSATLLASLCQNKFEHDSIAVKSTFLRKGEAIFISRYNSVSLTRNSRNSSVWIALFFNITFTFSELLQALLRNASGEDLFVGIDNTFTEGVV